ncbi:hypothetical protein [Maricaulis maris]|uniref:Uncharacterized protein n=1 Tax=Maricaulis maris TaxID=74318 RepID=A0A495DL64_9PROT|nr:hypothetical protein [Maricaulis maris]RKR03673.1 hypothetical protein C7435_0110 [Maricaulis maris]
MMKPLILLSVLAVGISGAEAQNQPQPQTRTALPTLRNPAILQRPGAEQLAESEDDASDTPVMTRRTVELYQQALEAEQRRAAGPRPRFYEVECNSVIEMRIDVTDMRITCDRNDPYGQNYYILWLDVSAFPAQDGGTNEERRWRAERLVEAVNITRNDPDAHLTLMIGPLDLNGGTTVRDLSGYTIRYSD